MSTILDKNNTQSGGGDWGLGIGDWGLGPIPNPQNGKIKILKLFYIISF
jgi:hypothetical protein